MYLHSKAAEALESSLCFASISLGFEVIQLWLEEGSLLAESTGADELKIQDSKPHCVYSFAQDTFKKQFSTAITGFWPDIPEQSLPIKVRVHIFDFDPPSLSYIDICAISIQLCELSKISESGYYWNLNNIPVEEHVVFNFPVRTEMSYSFFNEKLSDDSRQNHLARLYLTAVSTKEIMYQSKKVKFLEDLASAIYCAAFGFDEDVQKDGSNELGESPPYILSEDSTICLLELDVKHVQVVENESLEPEVVGLPINGSPKLPFVRNHFSFSHNADSPATIGIRTTRSNSNVHKSNNGSSDGNSSQGDATKSTNAAQKTSFYNTSTSSNKSSKMGLFTKRREHTKEENSIPEHIPTWDPIHKFHYPIALIPVTAPVPIGDLDFDDFVDKKHIANGSNSNIYLASWKGDERVILKIIKKSMLMDSVANREFDHEQGILARVSHPNIIKLLGSGTKPRRFMVLEFMPGGSLQSLLNKHQIKSTSTIPQKLFRKPSFNFMELLQHSLEIAQAVHHLHRLSHQDAMILHRGKINMYGAWQKRFIDRYIFIMMQ